MCWFLSKLFKASWKNWRKRDGSMKRDIGGNGDEIGEAIYILYGNYFSNWGKDQKINNCGDGLWANGDGNLMSERDLMEIIGS